MARPTTRRLAAPANFAPESQRTAPRLGVFAPLMNVRAEQTGAERLAEALGMINAVAQPALVDAAYERAADATRRGMLDATAGTVDEKLARRNAAYARGVKLTTLRAEVAKAKADFEAIEQRDGLAEADLDAYLAALEQFAAQRFGHLTDDEEARELLARELVSWRDAKVRAHAQRIVDEARGEAVDNVALIAADLYREGRLDTSSIIELDRQLRDVIGGREARLQLARIIANLAVENADPELLKKLPAKIIREDGTVIPGHRDTPETAAIVRDAELKASAEKEFRERKAREEAEAAIEAERESARRTIYSLILSGRDATAYIRDAFEAGILTVEDAEKLRDLNDEARDDRVRGVVNPRAVAEAEVAVYAGEMTAEDLVQRYRAGEFGYGDAARAELSRLLALDERRRTSGASEHGRRVDIYFDELRALYEPRKLVTGDVDRADLARQVDALREYRERTLAGEDPRAVRDDIVKRIPAPGAVSNTSAPTATPVALEVRRVLRGEPGARRPSVAEVRNDPALSPAEKRAYLERVARGE